MPTPPTVDLDALAERVKAAMGDEAVIQTLTDGTIVASGVGGWGGTDRWEITRRPDGSLTITDGDGVVGCAGSALAALRVLVGED